MSRKIPFYKYQGAGNDFILIDDRTGEYSDLSQELVYKMCDRRFGIGGDGLMLLQSREGYDFEMVYYNANGLEGSMCGNGGRCIVAFARDLGIIDHETDFLAVDGPHEALIDGFQVHLGMIDVAEIHTDGDAFVLNTGSPHYVKMVQDLANYPVYDEGLKIRQSEAYRKEGINVNFVEADASGYFVRTFERGVENETHACGTGATAAAMAMAALQGQHGKIDTPIRVLGGQLSISFHKEGNHFTQVFLQGPAEFVFQGEITL